MKSIGRIFALVLRYFYLIRTSFPRLLELMYWPTFQMILWGLIAKYIGQSNDTIIQIGGVLFAGVLLWDVLFRSQLGFSLDLLFFINIILFFEKFFLKIIFSLYFET